MTIVEMRSIDSFFMSVSLLSLSYEGINNDSTILQQRSKICEC
jgi:hypothetical protein